MLRILLSVRLGEKRWTQKQLADATGIRRNTINDLYHEMTDRVSLEQLDLICKALDCKISDLLVQEEDLDDLTRSRLATPRCRSITSDKQVIPFPRTLRCLGTFFAQNLPHPNIQSAIPLQSQYIQQGDK